MEKQIIFRCYGEGRNPVPPVLVRLLEAIPHELIREFVDLDDPRLTNGIRLQILNRIQAYQNGLMDAATLRRMIRDRFERLEQAAKTSGG